MADAPHEDVHGDKFDARHSVVHGDLVNQKISHNSLPMPSDLAVPRQLPRRRSSFTGRVEELALMSQQIEDADPMPILLLHGGAGVGKTALAVHWAHQVKERFPDGQLYVNLRGFDPAGKPMPPSEAIRIFLDAFQVPHERIPHSLEQQEGMYRTLVAERRMLILLDNALNREQLIPLLPGGHNCCVIVTSRSMLEGLVTLDDAHPVFVDLMEPDEALAMLSRSIGSDRVTAEPQAASALIEYCARLPLALSVMAARIKQRPRRTLQHFANELAQESSLGVLGESDDRNANVRAVFSWSYRMLGSEAAAMFRLLGFHPGPNIGVPAAAALAGTPIQRARTQLEELSRLHLVEETASERYSLHDLLRKYAAEQIDLNDAASAAQVREAMERVLSFYLHSAFSAQRKASPHWHPIEMPEKRPGVAPRSFHSRAAAIEWFNAEHANLISAIDYAAEHNYPVYACKLPWSLADYLYNQGHWHDWKRTQFISLNSAQHLGDKDAEARAHRIVGHALHRTGSSNEAIDAFGKSLALWRQLGDKLEESTTLLAMSWTYGDAEQWEQAHRHAQLALLGAHEARASAWEARALNQLSLANIQLGDYQSALDQAQRSLRSHEARGDRDGAAHTLNTLGIAYLRLERFQEATEALQRSAHLFRSLGDKYYEAHTLDCLGDAYAGLGEQRAALDAWKGAQRIAEQVHADLAASIREKISRLGGSMP